MNGRIISGVLVVLALMAPAPAEERSANPREVTAKYLKAVQAGKVDEAAALAVRGSTEGSKKRVNEYKERFGKDPIKMSRVFAGKKERSIAVSEAIKIKKEKPDEPDAGYLVIKLSKIDGMWLVKDVDLKDIAGVNKAIESFKKQNGEIEEVP